MIIMEQQVHDDIVFIMLYAGVAVTALIACCYLLFRRGNAFAADITPPLGCGILWRCIHGSCMVVPFLYLFRRDSFRELYGSFNA